MEALTACTGAMVHASQRCRILQLPAEVWQLIFEFTFADADNTFFEDECLHRYEFFIRPIFSGSSNRNILLTCKRLYHSGIVIFYQQARLHYRPAGKGRFIRSRNCAALAHTRRISLLSGLLIATSSTLQEFRHLREIELSTIKIGLNGDTHVLQPDMVVTRLLCRYPQRGWLVKELKKLLDVRTVSISFKVQFDLGFDDVEDSDAFPIIEYDIDAWSGAVRLVLPMEPERCQAMCGCGRLVWLPRINSNVAGPNTGNFTTD